MAEKATKAKDKAQAAPAASGKPVKSTNPARYRLRNKYKTEIVPQLMKERGYKNVNQVPKIVKIVLNMRLGDIKDNSKSIQLAQAELESIAGQKSVLVKAKKSVSNFKLREGQSIAIKVTLRGEMAYEFFDKLVSIALPRVRDFRGIPDRGFDGRGNFTLGIKEHAIFPEMEADRIENPKGMNITIVTTATTDKEGKLLLEQLGMPFRK